MARKIRIPRKEEEKIMPLAKSKVNKRNIDVRTRKLQLLTHDKTIGTDGILLFQ